MFQWISKKLLGSKNQRVVKRMWPTVLKINQLEEEYQKLSDDALKEKTLTWKAQLSKIEDYDELQAALEEVLPEAFAVVKNAARRLCGTNFIVCDQPMDWEMVHFDVQLIGGMSLHQGRIAEMATGEGKTLVATLPVYLNALTGRGVHVVTVNDYLAKRDSEWMGHLYRFLGLTVGCIQNNQPPHLRRDIYANDITYGTNAEFGFDYLRDNGMARSKEEQVQRGHYFAIVDEVDSVLIDEARTPLIISGPVSVSTHQFDRFKPLVDQLVRKQGVLCNELIAEAKTHLEKGEIEEAGPSMMKVKLSQPRNRGLLRLMEDPEVRRNLEKTELSYYQDTQKTALFALKEELYYSIDEKTHDADLSDKGRSFLNPEDPEAFVLPDLASAFSEIDGNESLSREEQAKQKEEMQKKLDFQSERIHNIAQLLKAYCLYERDREYVVEDNKVVIVDEHTGRKMPGRRWSDGLHQAVEAKEGVKIDRETQTLATITIQNYFRLYQKLSGMTGTAETEAAEFHDIYGLQLMVVPTNRPVQRKDENDHIYKTEREKLNAAVKRIQEIHNTGQPILVGTASVDNSEKVSRLLSRAKIPHNVLNAKHHAAEAEIVSGAGQKGSVTVSTNMAGRGTDIKLAEGVPDLGGLMVLATERHESRRIDRQLRGRCARQGDPGETIFFISFEDNLMRNFGASERMTKMMERFGLEEGQELAHPWLNKSVETAQKRVEARNYQVRKHILEYDNVMNQQRDVVYGFRNDILDTEDPHAMIQEIIEDVVPYKTSEYLSDAPAEGDDGGNDLGGLIYWLNSTFPLGIKDEAEFEGKTKEQVDELLTEKIRNAYTMKSEHEEPEARNMLEQHIMLNAVDRLWQEHLYAMDSLRDSVRLRSYGQKDPLVEYKNEAYSIFVELMDSIRVDILSNLFRSTTNVEGFKQFLASLHQGASTQSPADEAQKAAVTMGGSSTSTGTGMPEGASTNREEDENRPKVRLPIKRDQPKVGRNEPCPCGSGKKYKQCCGR